PDGSFKTVPQRTIATTPLPNPKIREADVNNQHLDALRKQKDDYTQRKLAAENSLRTELKSKQGFLEELSAIKEILIEKKVALFFYAILFCFLMSLELLVVSSKVGDTKSDYDLIVEHQLDQKRKTLKGLMTN
ncbi:MAG: DUF4407 domain-containing protein, partial [Flavobacterium sp.]